jgi:leucyl/phenylalanyl-tRNA--protein transferase
VAIPLLPPSPVGFPSPTQALEQPDGLLAAGGLLSRDWLLEAYARGIFPWFDAEDEHIFWWSPSSRAVIQPGQMRVTKSLRKRIRNSGFTVTVDQAFESVVEGCQAPRGMASGTWITEEMSAAYVQLHQQGFAHSFETWLEGELVGGLYGVSLGRLFFGESMFSTLPDASKIAFFGLQTLLQDWSFTLIDCQIMNPHLESLGVASIPRSDFLNVLEDNPLHLTRVGRWHLEDGADNLLNYAR